MDQLREFFAKLSFKVDDSGLKAFDSQLNNIKKKMLEAGVSAEQFENKRGRAAKKASKDIDDANKSTVRSEIDKQRQIDKAYSQRDKQLKDEAKKVKEVERVYAQKNAAEAKASEQKYRLMERQAAAQERIKARVNAAALRDEVAYLRGQQQAQAKLQAFGKIQSYAYQMRDSIERRTGLQQIAARAYDENRTRSLGLLQVAAQKEDARRSAKAATDERRMTLLHIQALEEDARRLKAAGAATAQREAAERKYALMMAEAHKMNALFDRGRLNGRGERVAPGAGLLAGGLSAIGGPIGAMAAVAGVSMGIKSFNDELQAVQSHIFQYQSVFGGKEQGRAAQEHFRAMAQELGINYEKSAPAYATAMSAGKETLGRERTEKLFKAMSEYSKVAGVRGAKYDRVIYALTESLGNNSLRAQEVNRQFNAAAPALKSLLAEAVTGKKGAEAIKQFNDMMSKKGGITLSKYDQAITARLHEEARKGGALQGAEADLNSQINRLQNAKFFAVQTLEASGLADSLAKVVENVTKGIEKTTEFFEKNKKQIKEVMEGLEKIGGILRDVIFTRTNMIFIALMGINSLITNLPTILLAVGSAIKKVWAATGPWGLLMLAIAIVAEDIWTWLEGGDSLIGRWIGPLEQVKKQMQEIKSYLDFMEPVLKILGQMAGGAAVGAVAGSVVPGVGTAAGAAAGAVAAPFAGAITGLVQQGTNPVGSWADLTGKSKQEQEKVQRAYDTLHPAYNLDALAMDKSQAMRVSNPFGQLATAAAYMAKLIQDLSGYGAAPLAQKQNSAPSIGQQQNTINIYPPAGSSAEDIAKHVDARLAEHTKQTANQATKGPR